MARRDDSQIFPPAQAAEFLERVTCLDPVDGLASVVETPLGLAALAAFVLDEQRQVRQRLDARGASLGCPADGHGDGNTRAVVDEQRRRRPQYERSLALAVAAFDLGDLCDERTGRTYGSRIPALARDASLCRLERIARRLFRISAPRARSRRLQQAAGSDHERPAS